MTDQVADALADDARALLAQGTLTGAWLRRRGTVETPVPVVGPEGRMESWFVPVVVGDVLAGYLRVPAGTSDWSWHTFMRHADSLAGCPPASLWLDREEIRQRASGLAAPDETVGDPSLGYDGVPDRLAWAVPLRDPDGATRVVLVAGRSAWPESQGPITSTDGTGGPLA
ncbi:MAG: hypothetical protein ACQERF_04770 [Actinomycetota bacterium]